MFEGSNGISQLFRLAYFALIAALCKRRVMQKRYFSKAGIELETCETDANLVEENKLTCV